MTHAESMAWLAAIVSEAVDSYPTEEERAGFERYRLAVKAGREPAVEDYGLARRYTQKADDTVALMQWAQSSAALIAGAAGAVLEPEGAEEEKKERLPMEKKKYVSRIETNVKSRRGVAYDLSPCTLITGTNGSGKSALIDAISLALTGESRTEGLRKQVGMLLRLAPPGPPGTIRRELYARANLSDGSEANFRIAGKAAEWSLSEAGVGPQGVIITDVARSLLYGDAKALMQAIARSTRAPILREALEGDVTKSVMPLFNEIWRDDCGLDSAPERTVEEVQRVLDATKRRLTEANAILKSARTGEALVMPLSEEDEAELFNLERVLAALRPGQTLEGLRDSLSDLPPFNPEEHERLVAKRDAQAHVKSLLELLDKHMSADKAFACPCCARPGMHRSELPARLARASASAVSLDTAVVRSGLASDHHAVFAAVQSCIARGMTSGDLQARRADLLRRKDVIATEPARAAVRAVTEDDINHLELIRSVCTEAIKNATDQQLGVVERRICRALPPNYRAKIVSEGGYRVELIKDKDENLPRDFRALSGGERAMLMSAFASATIPEGAPPVRLLVVDEVWLDTTPMKALLKAIGKVVGTEGGPTQAIVCAVKVSGKMVAGWSEVKLASEGAEDSDGGEGNV